MYYSDQSICDFTEKKQDVKNHAISHCIFSSATCR